MKKTHDIINIDRDDLDFKLFRKVVKGEDIRVKEMYEYFRIKRYIFANYFSGSDMWLSRVRIYYRKSANGRVHLQIRYPQLVENIIETHEIYQIRALFKDCPQRMASDLFRSVIGGRTDVLWDTKFCNNKLKRAGRWLRLQL